MERVMGVEPTPTAWKAVVLAVILHPHGELYHQPDNITTQTEGCQAIFLRTAQEVERSAEKRKTVPVAVRGVKNKSAFVKIPGVCVKRRLRSLWNC